MIVNMIQNLRNRMEVSIEKLEVFNKELENIKEQPNRDEEYNN